MNNINEDVSKEQSEQLLSEEHTKCTDEKVRCFIEGYFNNELEYELFLKTL